MKRYELIEQIALTKAAIMLKLDHLGIKSEIRTLPNGTKINSNPMMGTLIGIYSKEFYDHKTGDLKEKLGRIQDETEKPIIETKYNNI